MKFSILPNHLLLGSTLGATLAIYPLSAQAAESNAAAIQQQEASPLLAQSKVIRASDSVRSESLTAKVKGLKKIILEVDDVDGNANDWVNWTELYFSNAKGKKIAVTEAMLSSNKQGWGEMHVDSNVGGKPMLINGKKFAKGFGGHASSSIHVNVPKGAVKLTARVGLDDSAAIRDGKATPASIQASIYHDDGKWRPKGAPEIVSVDHFIVPEGLEVTLWASSPMLFNPTNMDIDSAGRIWIAEGVNYRREAGRRPEGDRIMVLEDTNGDGTADSSHVFVQEKSLETPLGVSVFDNKIVVPQPPHMVVYTDVDRNLRFDPKIDKREVLLTGFNARQHDHSLHSTTAGPDGKWYFNNGNCGAVFTDKSGKTFNMNGVYRGGGGEFLVDNNLGGKKSDDGFVWTSGFGVRMNPDGTNAEIFGHGYRNSYEQAVNSMGDVFQNDNDDQSSCRNSYVLEYGSAGFFSRDGKRMWPTEQRPGQPVPRAHWRQDDPGTFDAGDVYGLGSPTGVVFYENGALGDKFSGTYLASDAARNVVFGYQPEEKGAGFELKQTNFISSNDTNEFVGGDFTKRINNLNQADNKGVLFRPSDIAVGPDGALYVADWYDGRVGGHATIDPTCSGAIYRIAPKGFKPNVPKTDLTTIAGQIEVLKNPAVNVRHLGFNALKAGGEKSYDAVAALLDHPDKWIASRAIWLLPYLGDQGLAKAKSLLQDKDAGRRLVAYRALKRSGFDILPFAKVLASDPNTAVRRDVALSLRGKDPALTAPIFVTLAKGYDGQDKNYVESLGLGAENSEDKIWPVIKKAMVTGGSETWSDAFARITWRLWPVPAVADLKARAMNRDLTMEQRKFAVESIAFINHKDAADAMFEIAAESPDVKADAAYWLLKRGTGEWAHMDIQAKLKSTGIYDPEKIKVVSVTVPEPAPIQKTVTVDQVLKLKGDATKGKAAIMRCVMCHQIEGAGPNYGPALKGWGSTQSKDAVIRSIIEPSADIAHGFKGKEVILKDGTIVHGLVTPGDPLMVTSTGGLTQMIPKNKIKEVRDFNRSLMISAQELGLSAQDIADLVAFMQQWK